MPLQKPAPGQLLHHGCLLTSPVFFDDSSRKKWGQGVSRAVWGEETAMSPFTAGAAGCKLQQLGAWV